MSGTLPEPIQAGPWLLEPKAFELAGCSILSKKYKRRDFRFDHRFAGAFGMDPNRCATIWNMLETCGMKKKGRHPKHLMWMLMWLRVYATEEILHALSGCHENTVRKWVWIYVEAVASMEHVVSRNNQGCSRFQKNLLRFFCPYR